MPTINPGFHKMRSTRDREMRRNGQTSNQRSTRSPLEFLIMKTLAMIIMRVSMDRYAKANVGE